MTLVLPHAPVEGTPQFDWVLARDSIHDMPQPAKVLRGIHHSLRVGGVFSMVDINAHSAHADNMGNPGAPILYTISMLHCTTVSLANDGPGLGTRVNPSHVSARAHIRKSTGAMWGQQLAKQYLTDAGFDVSGLVMVPEPEGSSNLHYCVRRTSA